MSKVNNIIVLVVLFITSGCASIVSGTDQDISIDSNPKGAECVLTRDNKVLSTVNTPETIRISKLKHDIYAACNMEGFHESTAHINSGTQGSVFGNILLGGGIGWAVDSARGADNKYPEVVTITMVPLNQPKPEAEVFQNKENTEVGAETESKEAIEDEKDSLSDDEVEIEEDANN